MCKVVLFYLILGFSETSGNKEKYILGISFLFGWEVGFFVQNYYMKWEMLMMGEWWYSVAKSCTTLCNPWTAARQASLSITSSRSLLKLRSVEFVIPSNHLIFCHPLLLPSVFPSIRVCSNESVLHIRWPKYWSFSISPSSEYSGLISFRIDWFDLLAVQGTLSSLLQHHSSKPSILWCSAFFTVQLLHPYMTTGKTIALTKPLLAK